MRLSVVAVVTVGLLGGVAVAVGVFSPRGEAPTDGISPGKQPAAESAPYQVADTLTAFAGRTID